MTDPQGPTSTIHDWIARFAHIFKLIHEKPIPDQARASCTTTARILPKPMTDLTPTPPISLRGITWDHTRGLLPLVGAAQRLHEVQPHITVEWQTRSLQAFADQSLDDLAERFDLLVIDHPWAGHAASTGILHPLEDLLSADFLADQATQHVGPSNESYRYFDRQWALAIDAATPVASWRPDLLADQNRSVPATWDELIALAKGGGVAVPGIPQDTLMNFYMLCSRPGVTLFPDDQVLVARADGLESLERLRELASHLERVTFDWNPIRIYEAMSRTDQFAYCPFAYGYSNYARAGYAPKRLKFGDIVTDAGAPLQTTLGGTGLAISRRCAHPEVAAAFAKLVAGGDYQRTQYVENGGQPGHRTAWLDEENNRRTDGYFRDTLPCLDRAYLRPRFPGSLAFQDRDGGGAPIRDYLMHGGDPNRTLDEVDRMYRAAMQEAKSAPAANTGAKP